MPISRHLTGFLRNHGRISKGTLERSSSTYPHEIDSRRRGRVNANVVFTLDPSEFAEKKQRRFHIGHQQGFRPHVALHNQSSRTLVTRTFFYNLGMSHRPPYPPDTAAFLYYFSSPERPRIAGELRLRLAASDDHPSFERGSDLLKPNGRPWSRSLYTVSKYYIPLYEKLKEDGFVSDDLDAVLSTFPRRVCKTQKIYALNDIFLVDFSDEHVCLTVITEQGIEKVLLYGPCLEQGLIRRTTYTGSALARFERATHPEYKNTRTVVLRFLKMVTPVKRLPVIPLLDGFSVQPKEGDLYRRCKKASDKLNPPVWSANIDKSVGLRGLQLVWDT